ncbi:hypothetical protein EDB83DRAFT_2316239 [Lactarius deliciosus]|nr:hypothetical protein EDB83DRAFT_2316239 [Lactarius deliciosus]
MPNPLNQPLALPVHQEVLLLLRLSLLHKINVIPSVPQLVVPNWQKLLPQRNWMNLGIPHNHLVDQIAGALNSVVTGLDELLTQDPELSGEAHHTLNHFLTNSTIANIMGLPTPKPASSPLPPSLLKDLQDIKSSILALQKVSPANAHTSNKPSPPKPQTSNPQEPIKKALGVTISSFTKAATLPPCPSVVISLANTNWSGPRPTLAQICKGINDTLEQAQNNQVRVSAASCHTALVDNNPNYTSLSITQWPSWVKNPSSYTNGSVSSLVVAFEDPDKSLACGLLTDKVWYIFGNCATLRKWKQCPSPRKSQINPTPNSPTQSPHESVPTSPTPHFFNFPPDPDPALHHARPNTRSTQDMKGELDNTGRSRMTTRSANKSKSEIVTNGVDGTLGDDGDLNPSYPIGQITHNPRYPIEN